MRCAISPEGMIHCSGLLAISPEGMIHCSGLLCVCVCVAVWLLVHRSGMSVLVTVVAGFKTT